MDHQEGKGPKLHVMVLPFSGQGHINPMLQFAKRLASKGVHVTVATNTSIAHKMNIGVKSISFESVYDDTDEGAEHAPMNFKARMDRFETKAAENLPLLIGAKMRDDNPPVKCLVYDANLPWALKVAKQLGIAGAAFFTQSCTHVLSYYAMYLETLEKSPLLPPAEVVAELSQLSVIPPREIIELGVPNIASLGSYNSGDIKRHPVIQKLLSQFNGLEDADWILFNSFDNLEDEVVKWMAKLWRVKNIGPTLPSIYLDKRVEFDVDYGFNLYKPNIDTCMNWLNTKEPGSVVYVAFGSTAHLSVDQTEEIAEALNQTSSRNFLWVVRETEKKKLPTNFITDKAAGLVVSWCPQLDVLAHKAVGCFVTHCGWNSTIEALCFGVPMLPMPQFLDQLTHAFLVDQIWGVGIKPKADEKGLITRQEIGRCLDEIMYGDGGTKIKENAAMWKALAKEAVDEGGSSNQAIDDFIARLASPNSI